MEENNEEVFEAKKKRRPIDKMKLAKRLIASFIIIFMVFSVFGTLLFYLLNNNG